MKDSFQLSNEVDDFHGPGADWPQRALRLLRECYLTGAERERMERISVDPAPGRPDELFVEEIERREG